MSVIPPISIDLSELAKEFSLKEAQTDELGAMIVGAVTDRIYYNWHSSAARGLHSSRKAYLSNLQIGQITPLKKFIQLTGKLPNMIEDGVGAYDMKPAMLNSTKAKISKKGVRYIIIPFRHATSNALGEDAAFSNVMPPEIAAIARRLRPMRTIIGNTISRPESLGSDSIPKRFQIPNTRPAVSNLDNKKTFSAYEHKSSIYEGMIREQKTYERATQGQYVTFRRISENSDANSWINRGIMAHNFAKKALQITDVGNITDRAIDTYLQKLD